MNCAAALHDGGFGKQHANARRQRTVTKMSFNTADLYDEYGERLRVVMPMFRHFGAAAAFHGEIVTVKVFEDNQLVRTALSQDGTDRVLVIDGGGSLRTALVGDRIAQLACDNHWAGMVINGCIRDSVEINEIAIGIRALDTNPARPAKDGAGETMLPVSFGGVIFVPGEFLYADEDGVVVSATRLD
jgi:regulator of ribonuclease activity A